MDKRKLIYILILLLFCLASAVAEQLNFLLVVPEDYGVIMPPEAINLDRFVFELKDERFTDVGTLLASHYMDLGELSAKNERMRITLLYYGNKSSPYRVRVKAYSDGWYTKDMYGEIHSFPIYISWHQQDAGDHGISALDTGDGAVEIDIPPCGLLSGVPVVDLLLDWRGHQVLYPGEYKANVALDLEVI